MIVYSEEIEQALVEKAAREFGALSLDELALNRDLAEASDAEARAADAHLVANWRDLDGEEIAAWEAVANA